MSYHKFLAGAMEPYGSFEVFENLDHDWGAPGWYWWSCFPGCLPDGEASGPFNTENEAFLDATGDLI